MIGRAAIWSFCGCVAAGLVFAASAALAQQRLPLAPPFSIWDVRLGESITQIPEMDVIEIACGTNGGPASSPLKVFEDFKSCRPEQSGLYEVHFAYDDELDYIALALSAEFEILQDGTTVFSHPVMLSVLIDEDGIAQGIRILTDPRIPQRERRRSVTLIRNFKAKYGDWNLDCAELPASEGEEPAGRIFIKETCTGQSPDETINIRLDARYLRKKGQLAVNPETREVNPTYFESYTRMEMVQAPFEAAELAAQ